MALNFNTESEKPRFISKPNPLAQGSYQIFEYQQDKSEYEPVGDYILIDTDEDSEITAKKMVNIIAILNGRKPMVSFENLTDERVLFTMYKDDPNAPHETMVFRTFKNDGVSKDNAVLTMKRGCIT